MQLPVDIKAVFDEATDIDTARQTPVFAAVYIDESAPQDVQAFVRASFSTMASNARVSIMYYPAMTPAPVPEADLAVVVAGLDETTGGVAQMLREAGVPTMVVTTLPRLAGEIAQTAGNAIPEGDLMRRPHLRQTRRRCRRRRVRRNRGLSTMRPAPRSACAWANGSSMRATKSALRWRLPSRSSASLWRSMP